MTARNTKSFEHAKYTKLAQQSPSQILAKINHYHAARTKPTTSKKCLPVTSSTSKMFAYHLVVVVEISLTNHNSLLRKRKRKLTLPNKYKKLTEVLVVQHQSQQAYEVSSES